ncbi:T9SS type A sorting domain-containing protein [Flavobacterium sp. N502540]|uniref:T9SS type A sorting domain-containing protein n=1 Tax=Flavobacterium sp. N502540 TaxID=2986838 RepID=UPI0022246674|nr:T9SS type A sorting domain-containing protein [Flavobacterium sp. N502540]
MKTKLLLFLFIIIIGKIDAQQQIYSFNYNYPVRYIEYNDNIFFLAGNEDTGREIWKSNGTPEGTSLVKDVYPGKEDGGMDLLKGRSAILNKTLFFIAKDETSNGEIWKTDGTETGTVKVTNFLKGRVWTITAVGNSIYFLLKIDDTLQVWKTDGTSQGTILVRGDLPAWNKPTFEGKCNDTFVFTFQPFGTNNSRVWRSDGTADGTFPITAEIDGNGSGPGGTSALTQYIESNGKLYFVSRYHLFETDGTVGNTKIVSDLWNAQMNLVSYSTMTKDSNNLYFMFFSKDSLRMEIWKYDLQNKKASLSYKVYGSKYFSPSNLLKTDDSLLFCGPNNSGGTSLLSMDLGTQLISDLKELMPVDTAIPFIFPDDYSITSIYEINKNDYFITTGPDDLEHRKGWIFNKSLQTTENISALDNVRQAIVYKGSLLYGKENVLYRYSNDLSTISNDKQSFLSIFPNPSTDFVKLKTNNEDGIESVQIFDLNGKLVSDRTNFTTDKMDVSKLDPGVYILKAKVNRVMVSKKIIKK